MSLRSSKEKETYLLLTYHVKTQQPGEGYYNGEWRLYQANGQEARRKHHG